MDIAKPQRSSLALTTLTFFGQSDHPFTSQWAAAPQPNVLADRGEQLGILGVILQTGFLMGVVLALLRRFELPFGSLTLLIGANTAFVTLIRGLDPVILVGVLGGLMADLLVALLRPSIDRVAELRVFAFLAPALLYGLYFLGLILTDGVWWPVHVWAGAPVIAGLVGWLLSLVIVPPTPAAR